jgi:hypothetical protein
LLRTFAGALGAFDAEHVISFDVAEDEISARHRLTAKIFPQL